MKVFFESKLNEYLNDDLLEDNIFVDFILKYRDMGYTPDEIEDTVSYIVETME